MRNSILSRAALLCAALATAMATPLVAQDSTPSRQGQHSEFARRSEGEFSFVQSRPTGAFADNVGFGYGGNAAYLFHLDDAGVLSLRADLGCLGYGSESQRVPCPSTGRVTLKVSTDNYIVPVSIGPQLTWPRGTIRPYANAGLGEQFFFTQSSIDGTDGDGSAFSTTNQHDHTMSWVAGGGIYVPLYMKRVDALLDVGVRYFATG